MYVCMHVCMHTAKNMYVCMCARVRACVCVCVCVRASAVVESGVGMLSGVGGWMELSVLEVMHDDARVCSLCVFVVMPCTPLCNESYVFPCACCYYSGLELCFVVV